MSVLLTFAFTTLAFDWVWPTLLATWVLLGIGYSAAQTPIGRLLRRSAQPEDRPALFAAQFALSHAAWLFTYPLAGWLGATAGIPLAVAVHGILTLMGGALAAALWPRNDPDVLAHDHADLAPDHPHIREDLGRSHAHPFVIDDLHESWPAGRSG